VKEQCATVMAQMCFLMVYNDLFLIYTSSLFIFMFYIYTYIVLCCSQRLYLIKNTILNIKIYFSDD